MTRHDASLVDQLLQLAGAQAVASEIVQPDRDTDSDKFVESAHCPAAFNACERGVHRRRRR